MGLHPLYKLVHGIVDEAVLDPEVSLESGGPVSPDPAGPEVQVLAVDLEALRELFAKRPAVDANKPDWEAYAALIAADVPEGATKAQLIEACKAREAEVETDAANAATAEPVAE